MQTVKASVLIEDAYRLMDWDPDQLEPRQKAMARQALSLALQEFWESWWWEVLMQCRQVQLAAQASGTLTTVNVISSGDNYINPGDGTSYYYLQVSLVAGQSYQLAIGNGTVFTNGPESYSASGTVTPITGGTWTLYGVQATNPSAPLSTTATLTATSISVAGAGTYYWPQTDQYYQTDAPAVLQPPTDAAGNLNPHWLTWQEFNFGELWDDETIYNLDARVVWNGVLYGSLADDNEGHEPGTDANWYAVPSWKPIVPVAGGTGPYGTIRSITQLDPRSSLNAGDYETQETADGAVIVGLGISHPWVWSRRPTPVITGDEFSATATYTATAAADLVFDS